MSEIEIQEADWDGPVLDPAGTGSDYGYFPSIEYLRDEAENEGFDLPEHVVPCRKVPLKMDAAWFIEVSTEDYHEAVREQAEASCSLLQSILDQWVSDCVSAANWEPMYDKRVILAPGNSR